MSSSGSISGPSQGPEGIQGPGGVQGGGPDISGLMHAKIGTLGELKATLIQYLGEKDGTKFYNQFMNSICISMLSQLQHTSQQAKKAAHDMRIKK